MVTIVPFKVNKVELTPNMVFEKAMDAYSEVLLIGYDNDGALNIRSSGNMTHERVLWVIEVFKTKLLRGDYGDFNDTQN